MGVAQTGGARYQRNDGLIVSVAFHLLPASSTIVSHITLEHVPQRALLSILKALNVKDLHVEQPLQQRDGITISVQESGTTCLHLEVDNVSIDATSRLCTALATPLFLEWEPIS